MTDYGYRSKCCYAPIRMGRKAVKKTNVSVSIWICCKCKKRNVELVHYNKNGPAPSTRAFAEEADDI